MWHAFFTTFFKIISFLESGWHPCLVFFSVKVHFSRRGYAVPHPPAPRWRDLPSAATNYIKALWNIDDVPFRRCRILRLTVSAERPRGRTREGGGGGGMKPRASTDTLRMTLKGRPDPRKRSLCPRVVWSSISCLIKVDMKMHWWPMIFIPSETAIRTNERALLMAMGNLSAWMPSQILKCMKSLWIFHSDFIHFSSSVILRCISNFNCIYIYKYTIV